MRQGTYGNLTDLAAEITRRSEARKDFIANTNSMTVETVNGVTSVEAILPDTDTGVRGIGGEIKPFALSQIATRAGIPHKYFEKMRTEAPTLLDENINYWHERHPAPRMLRTLDGKVDAFLSDSYKRIDNYPVANIIFPVLRETDVDIESCDVTDTKMYIKVVSDRLQGDVKINDPIQMGLVISNSEVGQGYMSVQSMIYRLVCLNGMISGQKIGDGIRRQHRGEKQPVGVIYAEDTLAAHTEAMTLQIRDTVKQMLSPENFQNHLKMLKETTERKVTGDLTGAVHELGKAVGFTQNEGSNILRYLAEGGDLSQWGLLNAVTRYSQDVDSYDRATELEKIGGRIIELKPNQWRNIAEAVAA